MSAIQIRGSGSPIFLLHGLCDYVLLSLFGTRLEEIDMTDGHIRSLLADATDGSESPGAVQVIRCVTGLVRKQRHVELDRLLAIALMERPDAVLSLAILRALWPVPRAELASLPKFIVYVRDSLIARGDDPDQMVPPVR